MNIVFDELAGKEFDEAVEYYEFQIEGLGKKYKQEIRRALRMLQQFPEIGEVEEKDVRRYILHKFPYKILYAIEKNYIYILAIAHTHREPNYWSNRLNS